MASITREALYEKVWAQPMTKVAAEFGVSGTALKKTCIRYSIPTPARGYWAKLAHGRKMMAPSLPKSARSREIQISENPARRLPPAVRAAAQSARALAAVAPRAAATPVETPVLAATRKAALKAKVRSDGFVSVSGRGVLPLTLTPARAERAVGLVERLLAALAAQGGGSKVTEAGMVLLVGGEEVAIALEEKCDRTPHAPTAKELAEKARRDKLGWYASDPWPKYDETPSGRLAILIRENDYSGLRRTYADGKTRVLEAMLADVLAGLVEHAGLKQARRLKAEEEHRQWVIQEAERKREVAFDAREKQRIAFVDAADAELRLRAKYARVLAHLEAATGDDAWRVKSMADWVRLKLKECDARLGPLALDLSAGFAEVEFDEAKAAAGSKGDAEYRYYSHSAELQLWSIDYERQQGRRMTSRAWALSQMAPDLGASPQEAPCGGDDPE